MIPLVWLVAMFTLFWTCFGFVGELESEYETISAVGCCGIVVDDISDPSSTLFIPGLTHSCWLSNLTTPDAFNRTFVSATLPDGRETEYIYCTNSLGNSPLICNENADGVSIGDCLDLTILSEKYVCAVVLGSLCSH